MQRSEPLRLAIEKVRETRRLLASLITSSESFDYVKAKAALEKLEEMVRDLGRAEAQLVLELELEGGEQGDCILQFPAQQARGGGV